jgi:hypothetical protein
MLSPQASKMIDKLLATGLFGIHGRAGVAPPPVRRGEQELIYRGLREIEKPILKLRGQP